MRGRRSFPRRLLVLVALLVLVPAGGAVASQQYADTAGDAPGGAPDITQVTLSHQLAGKVTFQIAFANRTTIAGQDEVYTGIDSDQNPATGVEGIDYLVMVYGDAPELGWIAAAGSNTMFLVPVTWANQTMSYVVDKALIGNPTNGFGFFVLSHTGGALSDANTELVPHSGMLSYSLAVEISKIQLAKTVTTVKAGKVFSVRGATIKLTTDEVFKPETLTAKAKIGTKSLKPLAGGLSWKVPKAAKGKKLTVTMAASYQGMAKTQKLVLRIK